MGNEGGASISSSGGPCDGGLSRVFIGASSAASSVRFVDQNGSLGIA